MPIEIKELVIRAEVSERTGPERTGSSSDNIQVLKQEIISECVDKVMGIIKRQKER